MAMLSSLLPRFNNPDVVRSFRAQVRRRQDFIWMSVLYVFVLSIIYAVFSMERVSSNNWDGLFNVITVLQFYVFIGVGTLQTAGVFAQEQEKNSFDLLLMTPIQRSAIVVGRLFGAPLLAYLLLGLSIPFSFLCVLNGGASLGLFAVNLVQTLLCGLVFHSWGLLCSLVVNKQSNAYVMALISPLLMLLVLSWTLHSRYLSVLVLPIYPLTAGNAELMTDIQSFFGVYVYSFVLSWLIGVALIFWFLRMCVNLCDPRRQFFATSLELVGFYATCQFFMLGLNLPLAGIGGYVEKRASAYFELTLLLNLLLVVMLHQSRDVVIESLARRWKFAATAVNPYRLLGQNVYLINVLTAGAIGVVLLGSVATQLVVNWNMTTGVAVADLSQGYWLDLLADCSVLFGFTLFYSLLSNFLSLWSVRNERALLLGIVIMVSAFPVMVFRHEALSFPLNPFFQFLANNVYRSDASRVLIERGVSFVSAALLAVLLQLLRNYKLQKLMEKV